MAVAFSFLTPKSSLSRHPDCGTSVAVWCPLRRDSATIVIDAVHHGVADQWIIGVVRVKRVLDVGQQQRQRIGYRDLCSLILIVQIIGRCGACHESNRFLSEDTASTEYAIGFTEIALGERTIPDPLNEEIL